jgi:hypothetical protein
LEEGAAATDAKNVSTAQAFADAISYVYGSPPAMEDEHMETLLKHAASLLGARREAEASVGSPQFNSRQDRAIVEILFPGMFDSHIDTLTLGKTDHGWRLDGIQ